MSFKNVLVHVGDAADVTARIDAAIRLARIFQARLTGLYLVPPVVLSSSVASMVPSVVISRRLEEDAEARASAESLFRERATIDGFPGVDWRAPPGDVLEIALEHARTTDLFVLGQSDPADGNALFGEQLIATILLGGGHPVLIVPYIGAPAQFGENVLIATDGGREAARAISDAWPVLERARRVEVLMGSRPGMLESYDESNARLSRWLADHGIRCTVRRNDAEPAFVGESLLSRAADFGSDLIVMGGYGHSRMRELMLGGMTRTILASMTVPVLMSH